MPDAELMNIVDDTLLKDVLKLGKINQQIIRRICGYIILAELAGADIILNVCSSVSEVVDIARNLVSIPVYKIDEPMAELAIQKGVNIGVLATVKSTLDPTCRLLEKKAQETGKKMHIHRSLCPGAFEKLMVGDTDAHDQIVLEKIEDLSQKVDVIVLAQGTMERLVTHPDLRCKVPIFSSLRSGVDRVCEIAQRLKK